MYVCLTLSILVSVIYLYYLLPIFYTTLSSTYNLYPIYLSYIMMYNIWYIWNLSVHYPSIMYLPIIRCFIIYFLPTIFIYHLPITYVFNHLSIHLSTYLLNTPYHEETMGSTTLASRIPALWLLSLTESSMEIWILTAVFKHLTSHLCSLTTGAFQFFYDKFCLKWRQMYLSLTLPHPALGSCGAMGFWNLVGKRWQGGLWEVK